MRELRSCDFCGDEAAGVYEVVPGDIPGVDARRMVLCDACRDTLADIVDPLLEAGRHGGRSKAKRAAEADSEAASARDSGSQPSRTPEPEPETESEADAESSSDGAAESSSEADAETASTPGDGGGEPGDAGGMERGDVGGAAAGEAGEAGAPESDAESTAAESPSKPERIERPEGYGKVVRLVENRDAGIKRRDLEELASGAYGLSVSEVEAAIDFALEQGTFVETDRGLKTT